MNQFRAIILSAIVAAGCSPVRHLVVNAGEYDRIDCTVKTDVGKNANVGVKASDGSYVPSQVIEENGSNYLYFTLDGTTRAKEIRSFDIVRSKKAVSDLKEMNVIDDGDNIILRSGDKPILSYKYTVTAPPDGVDKVFQRSGYIHPAYTPSGFVFTNIQPRDHYHHYGVWNPWTKVEYKGRTYDLWNLGSKLGTVRAGDVTELYEGDVVSGFKAGLDHVAFTPEGEVIIMKEEWIVKVVDTGNGYLWDFESILKPSTDSPVIIKAYRYQGFSCRATAEWTRENSTMMTSEGLQRPEIDQTRARWIYVNGANGPDAKAGFMFLASPDNFNSPEPLRIWNQNANGGRGDVFVNFCPAKTTDWKLEPGNEYHLHYRVMAYDGEMTPERAEQLWRDFVYPPKTEIRK